MNEQKRQDYMSQEACFKVTAARLLRQQAFAEPALAVCRMSANQQYWLVDLQLLGTLQGSRICWLEPILLYKMCQHHDVHFSVQPVHVHKGVYDMCDHAQGANCSAHV